jgi:hypothetical protein
VLVLTLACGLAAAANTPKPAKHAMNTPKAAKRTNSAHKGVAHQSRKTAKAPRRATGRKTAKRKTGKAPKHKA